MSAHYDAGIEKGHRHSHEAYTPDPFEHGAATVAEASGRGGDMHRGLKSRHIQFLALGGAIGTGLFVGSGGILALVGPAPLFMAYLSMMVVVWNVMNNLAEIVVYLPMKGITIPYFVKRFVDPSLAFAAGWNYWYACPFLHHTKCRIAD
jgi:amino acid transporter